MARKAYESVQAARSRGGMRLVAAGLLVAAALLVASLGAFVNPADARYCTDEDGPGVDFNYSTVVTSSTAQVAVDIDTGGDDTNYFFRLYEYTNKVVVAESTTRLLLGRDASGADVFKIVYTFTDLLPGHSYYFEVDAENYCGVRKAQDLDPIDDPTWSWQSFFRVPSRLSAGMVGTGTIKSDDGKIDCGTKCVADYPTTGQTVHVTATPGTGSVFLGWDPLSDCKGQGATCAIILPLRSGPPVVTETLDAQGDFLASAIFGDPGMVQVLLAGSGRGAVTSSVGGINCSPTAKTCRVKFDYGQSVTLKATPEAGSSFIGWGSDSGVCSGPTTSCTFKLEAPTSITAQFAYGFPLTVSTDGGSGSGRIVSTPAGINCPNKCSAVFEPGTQVNLEAMPSSGSTFTGWDGACFDRSPQAPCTIVITGETELAAEFTNPEAELGVVRVDESKNGKKVTLRKGGQLIVTLPGKRSGGFSWKVAGVNRSLLKPLQVRFAPPAKGAAATGGTYTVKLKALKKGKTTLKLAYKRSGSSKASRTFTLNVVVR